ncbi:MAG: glycoside hydrolase family 38 C-terminal domain-containing protein [Thermodesulfobacteriota bacterium]|nr:glycoside hydrolase family 38 C-terminal domain-containing protein [Thermodesulfobacteriota bacterium]
MVKTKKMKDSKNSKQNREGVLNIHIFSHTHWDFEWYEVQEGYKLQLVRLIEHLLDTLERDPKFKFHFDGQVMPIIDYLKILKEEDDCDNKNRVDEAERKISQFVKRKQLSIGPCWSTPETSLISNESLIRNINRGIRFSQKFGFASSVFYNADAFQYHSQVPQIIEGAGLKAAFTWRAFKHGEPLKDLAMWKGADSTAIIKYHPPRAYAQTWYLPEDLQETSTIIKEEAALLKNFAVTDHVLITQGNDQFEAQSDVNQKIIKINQTIGKNYRVGQITLEDFFQIIEREKPKLGILQGELTGNKWACTLSGQLSARMYLKQKNKEAEISIEKWAEPFATFAWLLGDEYPAGLMERAWEYLMKQHFHHCNACAIDEVHREGEVRYKNAIELARDITDESLLRIASKINSSDMINENEHSLVIFNPSDIERTDVVNVEIDLGSPALKNENWQLDKDNDKLKGHITTGLALRDKQGKRVPFQILNKKEGRYRFAFMAEKIPPFGYKTLALDFPSCQEIAKADNIADEKEDVLENDILKVKINKDGSLTILDKRNRRVFKDLNIIEDTADHGDTYNYDPLKRDTLLTSKGARGKVTLKENGPFLATYEANIELVLPESLTSDRKARSKKLKKNLVSFYITLRKGSPLVSIATKIDNQVKDHRMRALFKGVKSEFVYVQTQGDIVKRKIEKYKDYPQSKKRDTAHSVSVGNLPKEKGPSPTQFQRNFVGINNGTKGLVILNKGLPEYEAKTDGTIALTLLRCVGWLSQDDLSTRERLAGPKVLVPDAQCIGEYTFEYAILIQEGPWEMDPIYIQENLYSIQTRYLEVPSQKGQLPCELSFLQVKPDALFVSAIKKAYSDNDLIIRLFNPSGKNIKGSLEVFPGIKEAWLVDLNEEKKETIPVQPDGSLLIEGGSKKIVTIRIVPEDNQNIEAKSNCKDDTNK